ncbi:MAG: GxxExxY protein [Ferruginibacter sp.]
MQTFIVFDEIVLEIKSAKEIVDEHVSQAINYLRVADKKLALVVNFARNKLEYKRVIY